ncbi:fluoride efflux transporter FluC [Lederbergia panacisoli]|uniref:fluoride efflux transporter FluC n=1 Tax=Lederbergia panacisoli TaxID=1255251 RepID=UPI00214CDCAA|nr:CrcB family protein [Lederbergia panacisoli]MCR2820611.1 CrcB family protein [Lederbergia panacisoli]
MTIFYVAIGGFFGAIARYGIGQFLKHNISDFPFPTILVNIIGSFSLGVIIGSTLPMGINLLFGVGFLGSFTTYSTFMVENVKLILEKKWKSMLIYTICSYFIGMLLAFAGLMLGISIGK